MKYEIKVPATSANMGSGFDSLGIALNLFNTYTFETLPPSEVEVIAQPPYNNENHMTYRAFLITLDQLKKTLHVGVRLTVETQIPICRGLGSSAACIVGGIIGAFMMTRTEVDLLKVLEIATLIEGHPDNVAPAIYGGCIASLMTEDDVVYKTQIKIKNTYRFIAVIPNFKLSTKVSREALPKMVKFKDATYNICRVAMLISSLQNGEDENLKEAMHDKLHQNYRKLLIRGYAKISGYLEEHTLGAFLSGAGPTILAIIKEDDKKVVSDLQDFVSRVKPNWEVKLLDVNETGAIYERK